MKNSNLLRTLLMLVVAAAFCPASYAQTDAQKAFAAIKAMPGMWEGKTTDGRPVQVSFKVTSGGTAVESEILGEHSMISMFHLDGPNKLLITHYCSMGNQPRMAATVAPDGKTITFNYMDATNLASPDAGHMQKMILTLVDDKHHTETWVFADHGNERTETFDLYRKM